MSDENLTLIAEEFCRKHGFRFTEPRRVVLEIISQSQKPIGAYDILDKMRENNTKPAPPTAYRAIDFWQAHGFVHKIESLNAFITCHAGHSHKGSQFLVCNDCGDVEEVHLCDMPKDLKNKLSNKKFEVNFWNAEIHGRCRNC